MNNIQHLRQQLSAVSRALVLARKLCDFKRIAQLNITAEQLTSSLKVVLL